MVKDMRSCVKRREVSADLEVYVPGASKISGHLILLLEVLKAKAIGNTTITNSAYY